MSQTLPEPRIEKGRIWCPLKNDWLRDQPEERVRQGFILHLHDHYGYAYDQMGQELRTQSGQRSSRVDIGVWASAEHRAEGRAPVLVMECKAENVDLHPQDYYQGESYARAIGEPCEFLVMHNRRQTAYFRLVRGLPGKLDQINVLPKAADWGDAKRLEAVRKSLRAFSRKEFQDLLFECHNILRDVHKLEPGAAFDAISKVLFVKMYVERMGTHGTFTTAFLRDRARTRLPGDPPVHEALFNQTREHYRRDELFGEGERLDIAESTFERLVQKLERSNLSATGDDIKGLAFERFLGDTFRGNLGQFFTPRPVVNFMADLLDPAEGERICDPAAGSGGFLIRAFEHVRAKIEADVQARKDDARAAAEAEAVAQRLSEDEEEARVEVAFARLNRQLDPEQADPPSRVRRLAHDCIFGTDAEPRAARTAKMNMIMHGDGHGGIHYHDGLLDVNGIFEGRFDVVLTNPPFGATVGRDQRVGATEQTRVLNDPAQVRDGQERYGPLWAASHARLAEAAAALVPERKQESTRGRPILDLFEIGEGKNSRDTEVLFLERCLRLLKPGGRLGIVLPDGNLNNPSLGWLRRWAEGKARLLAVVSLPEETFSGAKASVKASLLFLRRFDADEEAAWEGAWASAYAALDLDFDARRTELCEEYAVPIASGGDPTLEATLSDLDAFGAARSSVTWRRAQPPKYPRGVVTTEVVNGRWPPVPKDKERKAQSKALRSVFDALWSDAHDERAGALTKRLAHDLRRVDREHGAALWRDVREALDYPVFTAAPPAVGITSTGADGPNDLPDVLADYRRFAAWVAAGAVPDDEPAFAA